MKTQESLLVILDRHIKKVRDSGQEPISIRLGREEMAIIGSEFIHKINIMQEGKKVSSSKLFYDLIPVEESPEKVFLMVVCDMPIYW